MSKRFHFAPNVCRHCVNCCFVVTRVLVAGGGVIARSPNSGLSENCREIFSLENFRPKMEHLGLKTFILAFFLGKMGTELKFRAFIGSIFSAGICSCVSELCSKFEVSFRKLQLRAAPTYLIHDAAGDVMYRSHASSLLYFTVLR